MRLVSFRAVGGPMARFGIWEGDYVIEPSEILLACGLSGDDASVATEMVSFFASGGQGAGQARRAVDLALDALSRGHRHGGVHDVADVRMLPPVARPRRIRDYMTYRGHATGSGVSVSPAFEAMPICYKCNVESVIGPEETIPWPSYTRQLDFELELGFFTGAGGRDLTPDEAGKRIAGVTIFNDVSARDIQLYEMSLTIGPSKGKDFCSVMGPCVLTMDEVDEWSVEMSARVNGELWVDGTTRDRQFSFAEVLAWASLDEDVHPGEFFAVGTVPGGCGYELDRWIQPGDVVELAASGVGVLRNTVGTPARARPGAGIPSYTRSPEVHLDARR